jgi:UDP-2,3-diacylglucosamine pyrophosphatase LpxH
MIILVSDLHLADVHERSTIDTERFLTRLTNMVRAAGEDGVRELTIVLLGDIFEILKSKRWLSPEGLRPWDLKCTEKHVDTVASIFGDIEACNPRFFTDLRALTEDETVKVKLAYVPGNHDLPINTEMGRAARVRLRELLPLRGTQDDPFREFFNSREHRLQARHGHEWDKTNVYGPKGAAIGDAVVVEVLLRLPMLVAEQLRLSDENDEHVNFLHELDNVRPQASKVMAQWVLKGMAELQAKDMDAKGAFKDSFKILVNELNRLDKSRFASFAEANRWIRFFSNHASWPLKLYGGYMTLKTALLWEPKDEGSGIYGEMALRRRRVARNDFRYLVCGHTHDPMVVPLAYEDGRGGPAPLYLNTGTWRKVHRVAGVSDRQREEASFARWDEECIVCIYDEAEQKSGLPPYEFHRVTRGAN